MADELGELEGQPLREPSLGASGLEVVGGVNTLHFGVKGKQLDDPLAYLLPDL